MTIIITLPLLSKQAVIDETYELWDSYFLGWGGQSCNFRWKIMSNKVEVYILHLNCTILAEVIGDDTLLTMIIFLLYFSLRKWYIYWYRSERCTNCPFGSAKTMIFWQNVLLGNFPWSEHLFLSCAVSWFYNVSAATGLCGGYKDPGVQINVDKDTFHSSIFTGYLFNVVNSSKSFCLPYWFGLAQRNKLWMGLMNNEPSVEIVGKGRYSCVYNNITALCVCKEGCSRKSN